MVHFVKVLFLMQVCASVSSQGGSICLTLLGFNALLCSPCSDLMDPRRRALHQDLSRPLSDYWINSSHNTYLCGDQVWINTHHLLTLFALTMDGLKMSDVAHALL